MEQVALTISTSDALILQSLGELGEEELEYIAQEIREPRGRILACLAKLKRKGLVHMHNKYGEIVISLTDLGKQTIHYLWPEAGSVKAML